MSLPIRPFCLDLAGVAHFSALSESTVQKMIRETDFPRPRLMSGRRVAWLVRELEEWIEARPVSEQLPPSNTASRKMAA